MGQPAALAFCLNLKSEFGIEVNDVTTEKNLIYVETTMRLMFGCGADPLIRLLHNELQK